jgi:hypothetical protein
MKDKEFKELIKNTAMQAKAANEIEAPDMSEKIKHLANSASYQTKQCSPYESKKMKTTQNASTTDHGICAQRQL